ncbi:Putative protein [Zobellia galactanivorans]|uniref:Uncharacterized protein n=1 Tax=Zobellia galactanivorans (strain DSM 12802 / CCUG 47099 / CIP 106680 / NCIMB 13871 / Dsij) TaxID=63186 RepID=G0KZH8_ZOBGA|nr:Putative protein [Zobellia galactanivorans]
MYNDTLIWADAYDKAKIEELLALSDNIIFH